MNKPDQIGGNATGLNRLQIVNCVVRDVKRQILNGLF